MARIHSGFYVDGPRESSFLRKFVDYFYEIKEREEREGRKDSPLYLVAKLLMNALYGKLIEIRIPSAPILPEYLYSIIYLNPDTTKIDNYREYAQTWIDGAKRRSWNCHDEIMMLFNRPEKIPKNTGLISRT